MSKLKPETNEEKIEAVVNWVSHLQKNFPLPRRVYLRYIFDTDAHGYCDLSPSKKSFIIWLSLVNNIANLCEWLMHEWAHAGIWDLHNGEDHPPEFHARLGRIRNFMIDQDGVRHILVPEGEIEDAESHEHAP